MEQEFNVNGELVRVEIARVINAGYSGRDEAAVQAHIDEMVEAGLDAPDEVPITFELAPYTTLVDPGQVTVVGEHTTGEAEYGLVIAGEETYVVAASDQTDRELEPDGIQLSKQVAPNILSRTAWRLSNVRDHWDDIELTAWNSRDGEQTLYQHAPLEDLLPPEEILALVTERYGDIDGGTVVLSGTIATVSGELEGGDRFIVELTDPVRNRELTLRYGVREVTS